MPSAMRKSSFAAQGSDQVGQAAEEQRQGAGPRFVGDQHQDALAVEPGLFEPRGEQCERFGIVEKSIGSTFGRIQHRLLLGWAIRRTPIISAPVAEGQDCRRGGAAVGERIAGPRAFPWDEGVGQRDGAVRISERPPAARRGRG